MVCCRAAGAGPRDDDPRLSREASCDVAAAVDLERVSSSARAARIVGAATLGVGGAADGAAGFDPRRMFGKAAGALVHLTLGLVERIVLATPAIAARLVVEVRAARATEDPPSSRERNGTRQNKTVTSLFETSRESDTVAVDRAARRHRAPAQQRALPGHAAAVGRD